MRTAKGGVRQSTSRGESAQENIVALSTPAAPSAPTGGPGNAWTVLRVFWFASRFVCAVLYIVYWAFNLGKLPTQAATALAGDLESIGLVGMLLVAVAYGAHHFFTAVAICVTALEGALGLLQAAVGLLARLAGEVARVARWIADHLKD